MQLCEFVFDGFISWCSHLIYMLPVTSCLVIYMRKWTIITACWTEWCVDSNDVASYLNNLVIEIDLTPHWFVLLFQGNDMDASRGILAGTVDKFKMVFCWKNNLYKIALKFHLCWCMLFRLWFGFPVFICLGIWDQIKQENVYTSGIICGHFRGCILPH